MSRTGRFIVVSAPSGTGKTTLVKKILQDFSDLSRSISCTTRSPRPGEREGIDYQFIDEETFRRMIREDRFFEWEEVHGALYGTPKESLLKRRVEGRDTVLDIDTRGALNLKKTFPDSCLIFLLPPSLPVLEERLKKRRTEEKRERKRRLEDARREMAEKEKFDHVVVNDDVDRAYQELKRIILSERGSPSRIHSARRP